MAVVCDMCDGHGQIPIGPIEDMQSQVCPKCEGARTVVDTCVHTEHCCKIHGCKYNKDDCPVVLGLKPQSCNCETCDMVLENAGLLTEDLRHIIEVYEASRNRLNAQVEALRRQLAEKDAEIKTFAPSAESRARVVGDRVRVVGDMGEWTIEYEGGRWSLHSPDGELRCAFSNAMMMGVHMALLLDKIDK